MRKFKLFTKIVRFVDKKEAKGRTSKKTQKQFTRQKKENGWEREQEIDFFSFAISLNSLTFSCSLSCSQ